MALLNTDEDDNNLTNPNFENILKVSTTSKTYGLYFDKSEDQLKISNFPINFVNGINGFRSILSLD